MSTERQELCANCGHWEAFHARGPFARCLATIDTRPVATGGDTLAPCSCPGFQRSFSETEDLADDGTPL